MSGMNNLTTLIKRLEAATSRLEDLASSATSTDDLAQPNGTPSNVASKIPSVNGNTIPSTLPSGLSESLPASVTAFEDLLTEDLQPFAALSKQLGGLVEEQSAAFCDAFKSQRDVLLIASKAKEPGSESATRQEVLKDLINGMQLVDNVREKNRKSPQDNHLAMLADGVQVLSWVVMPAPAKYVQEILDTAQYSGNRIRMQYKDTEPDNVEWVRSFIKLCGALIQFIKQYAAQGLSWNSNGISAEEALREVKMNSPSISSSAAIEASRGSSAPPPPPPLPQFDTPPPPPPPAAPGARSVPAGDMGAVFSDLNRGEAVTANLRKVDTSQMTHKNPSLRAQGTVPSGKESPTSGRGKSPSPPVKQKPEGMRQKRPSKKELEGIKWIIENFENEQEPINIDAEKQQSILISRCKKATIRVKGKANAISIDNCSRVDIIVDNLVSSVDVVNTENFRLQVLGTLPSVIMDKVDVGTVYLSKESLEAEIFTSKCTSINITLPPPGDDDDSSECPVPEQIKSKVVDGKLVSEIVKQEG